MTENSQRENERVAQGFFYRIANEPYNDEERAVREIVAELDRRDASHQAEKEKLEDELETSKKVQAELQKELNKSGSGRGEWHVAHSCVPKSQYWALEKKCSELGCFLKEAREVLSKIANREIVFPDYDWSDWNGHDAQCEATNLIAQFAQLYLTKLSEKGVS